MAPVPPNRQKRLVGTSLKMYFDLQSTVRYIDAVAALSSVAEQANIDLFVIPDFVSLLSAQQRLSSTSVWLGAQDCFSEDRGAFTGEISPLVLRQAGVKIVEIGHAERRRLFGETDGDVANKAAAVIRNGMIPLICIGEKTKGSPITSQAVGMAVSECATQIKTALSLVPGDALVILAYEPVWAIGASEPAAADHVIAVTQNLRALVADRAGATRILYGGSAGPGTFTKLKDGVDGCFLADMLAISFMSCVSFWLETYAATQETTAFSQRYHNHVAAKHFHRVSMVNLGTSSARRAHPGRIHGSAYTVEHKTMLSASNVRRVVCGRQAR
nr:putative triosephosphate isomerase [Quercus suber]